MAKTSEDQFGKEGFKMAKKLKKYRKNQNLSISYQAVVIDFNWRLHHNNHNLQKKNQPTPRNLMNDLLVQNRNPPLYPPANSTLPTTSTSHLHLGPRRRASAHDICRLTFSLPSLRNRDMQLTEPWDGFVCGRDGTTHEHVRSHLTGGFPKLTPQKN